MSENGTCDIHPDGCTKFQRLVDKVKIVEKTTETTKKQFWAIILLLVATLAANIF